MALNAYRPRLLVDATPEPGVRLRLERAFGLTTILGGDVTGACFAWPASEIRDALLGNPASIALRTKELKDAVATTEAIRDDVAERAGAHPEWLCGLCAPADALVDAALLTDLMITGVPQSSICALADPAAIALRSGVPVLRLGDRWAAHTVDHVVLAWKDAREARAALMGAMPVLTLSARITVVGVGDEVALERLDAVAAYLNHRGLNATARHLPARETVHRGLLEHLRQEGWPLVVAGARGRGLWTERLFGGVTRELLDTPDASWLMAT